VGKVTEIILGNLFQILRSYLLFHSVHPKFGREAKLLAKNRLELSAQAAKSGLPPENSIPKIRGKIAIS
jgi:hypothetical protein